MQVKVYIDILFLINFAMNYFLLILTKRILRRQAKQLRLLGASIFGALIACIIGIILPMPVLPLLLFLYLIVGIFMMLFAFGNHGGNFLIRNYVTFLIVTFTFGGLVYTIRSLWLKAYRMSDFISKNSFQSIPVILLLLAMLAALLFVFILFRRFQRMKKMEQNRYIVTLQAGDFTLTTEGLLDTGNSLQDPIHGYPVILICNQNFKAYLQKVKLTMPEKLRYIPFSCIGTEKGILDGVKLDSIELQQGNEKRTASDVIGAVSDQVFGMNRGYDILLHPDLLVDSREGFDYVVKDFDSE